MSSKQCSFANKLPRLPRFLPLLHGSWHAFILPLPQILVIQIEIVFLAYLLRISTVSSALWVNGSQPSIEKVARRPPGGGSAMRDTPDRASRNPAPVSGIEDAEAVQKIILNQM